MIKYILKEVIFMYTPLYIKTDYSLLNSLIKIDDLIKKLKKLAIQSEFKLF